MHLYLATIASSNSSRLHRGDFCGTKINLLRFLRWRHRSDGCVATKGSHGVARGRTFACKALMVGASHGNEAEADHCQLSCETISKNKRINRVTDALFSPLPWGVAGRSGPWVGQRWAHEKCGGSSLSSGWTAAGGPMGGRGAGGR